MGFLIAFQMNNVLNITQYFFCLMLFLWCSSPGYGSVSAYAVKCVINILGRYIFLIFGLIFDIWPTVGYIHDSFHNPATYHTHILTNYFKCNNLYS